VTKAIPSSLVCDERKSSEEKSDNSVDSVKWSRQCSAAYNTRDVRSPLMCLKRSKHTRASSLCVSPIFGHSESDASLSIYETKNRATDGWTALMRLSRICRKGPHVLLIVSVRFPILPRSEMASLSSFKVRGRLANIAQPRMD